MIKNKDGYIEMNLDHTLRALESLNKAQKLLDERFEKKQIDFGAYQKQCQEFGKRREKLRKQLGEEKFNEICFDLNNM